MKIIITAAAAISLALSFSSNASVIDINFGALNGTAYTGQPGGGTGGTSGSYIITDAGTRLKTYGDLWVNFEQDLTIDSGTVLNIEVRNRDPQTSEILGIMFLDNFLSPTLNPSYAFSFAGSQTWGIDDHRTTSEAWESFSIDLGSYASLNNQTFKGISFFTDDDSGGSSSDANGRFRNVSIAQVPEPSVLALMGLGILGMGIARRRQKS
jgi:hypothetical protein